MSQLCELHATLRTRNLIKRNLFDFANLQFFIRPMSCHLMLDQWDFVRKLHRAFVTGECVALFDVFKYKIWLNKAIVAILTLKADMMRRRGIFRLRWWRNGFTAKSSVRFTQWAEALRSGRLVESFLKIFLVVEGQKWLDSIGEFFWLRFYLCDDEFFWVNRFFLN